MSEFIQIYSNLKASWILISVFLLASPSQNAPNSNTGNIYSIDVNPVSPLNLRIITQLNSHF